MLIWNEAEDRTKQIVTRLVPPFLSFLFKLHLIFIQTQDSPVLLFPVVQVVGPGLPSEAASFLRARVTSVDLLMPLQFARKGEPHFTTVVRAPVRRQLGVPFANVGFQLFVLLELESAAVPPTRVLLPVRTVYAADVPGSIGVSGEGVLAAVYRASKRLHATVTEVMPGQVILATEGLPATVAVTCKRFYSRVFTQMSVQFPLFVIGRLTSNKRADITFLHFRASFHCWGINKPSRGTKSVTNTFQNLVDISHDHLRCHAFFFYSA